MWTKKHNASPDEGLDTSYELNVFSFILIDTDYWHRSFSLEASNL